jgi:intron-binding protein aquarius
MEEAAQVLDIETFIPLLLQSGGVESKLKRFVLIGDQHQLPPVISNEALASFAHLDQSMFSRFVRSGVPTIQLDAQGRARASLANLYRWRYEQRGASLGDLPLVAEGRYRVANAGCALEYQWVNVTGVESAPRPNMWQSIEEAEYVVAVYRYMRLIGHPAASIAILSTYRGQVSLINDVLAKRVAPYPFFGMPVVSTVDSFQGSAADIVLLSLVRSTTVGFMRDVRRWVVALSRARLGLYIFGNQALYAEIRALDGAFSQLAARPTKLLLVAGERFPTQRAVEDVPKDAVEITDVAHIGAVVREMEVAAGL